MSEEKKPKVASEDETPILRVDPDALGRAWVKAVEEEAKEQAGMPAKFEKGEGMRWPLSD